MTSATPPTPTRLGSEAVTAYEGGAIRIVVEPAFEPAHSDPAEPRYIFSYHIRITNEAPADGARVQLLTRRWLIVDALGRDEEVTGEGVVGRLPELGPGESFEYSSWAPLRTSWGTMEGSYRFRKATGEVFTADIARFYLAAEPAS
ncbi:MAG: Co2+/Mg2+ efflux protein ApaG [Phycisphaerales bacterium JB039]